MYPHLAAPEEGLRAQDPEPTAPDAVHSKDAALAPQFDAKNTGSDESPAETDSPGEAEFKEGGYGW